MHALRQSSPTDRQLAADRLGASGLEVADELPEQTLLLFELEPERAAQPQVVIDVRLQAAHRCAPPGHGAANSRSRSTSTRA
jgi:hypothetical protein